MCGARGGVGGGALEEEVEKVRTGLSGASGRAGTVGKGGAEEVGAGHVADRTRMVGVGEGEVDVRPVTRPGLSVRRGGPLSRGFLSLCEVFLALFVPSRVARALSLFPWKRIQRFLLRNTKVYNKSKFVRY